MTIAELGRGAYGVVEKVRHAQSGTIMAVKVSGVPPCRGALGHRTPGGWLGGPPAPRPLTCSPLVAADPGHRELPGAEAPANGLGCEHAHS